MERTSIERFIRDNAVAAPGLAALRMKSASHVSVASSCAMAGANDSSRYSLASSFVPQSRSLRTSNSANSVSCSSAGTLNG